MGKWTTRWLALILVSVIASLSVFPAAMPVSAQTIEPPLVVLMDGDLWSYQESTATLTQLTRWGYNETPVISPDGKRVAYASIADIAIEALKRFGDGEVFPPNNLYILDMTTMQPQRIAAQPTGATFMTGNSAGVYVHRTTPTWSPDSSMLAWIEFSIAPQPSTELVIFDVKANQTRARTSLNMLVIPPFTTGPEWSSSGIFIHLPPTETGGDTLLVFDGNGSLRLKTPIAIPYESIVDVHWVTQNSAEFVGVSARTGAWTLINPGTGATSAPSGIPEVANAANAISAYYLTGRATQSGLQWLTGDQDIPLNFSGYSSQISIAPSGRALAYASDAVYILRGGQVVRVPGTERINVNGNGALAWSYGKWRVRARQRPQPTVPPIVMNCPGAPPTRLTIGSIARVTLNPAQPNALNSAAGRPSLHPGITRITLIPSGQIFTVLDGPVCVDNYLWWKVNFNNLIGWTAEGEGAVYWVEPFNGPLGVDCPKNLPSRLVAGNQGRVVPGIPNALRSQPSKNNTTSTILGGIPSKGVFTVINGPTCADGYAWWQVNYNGVVGWTPEGENGVYWLEPLICGFRVPSRLQAGKRGIVLPGLPNALRGMPSKKAPSALLGEIPTGAVFDILSGPVCGDNLVWWQINYAGLVGWTPEGEGETYWLGPVQ